MSETIPPQALGQPDGQPGRSSPIGVEGLDLNKAVAVLGALAAFGYWFGWRFADAYYNQFGASWIASQLSPQSFLINGWSSVQLAVIVATITLRPLLRGAGLESNVTLLATALLVAGILPRLLTIWISVNPYVLSAGGWATAIAYSIMIVMLLGDLRRLTSNRDIKGALGLVFAILPTTIIVPTYLGESSGIVDLDRCASSLPRIELSGGDATTPLWALYVTTDRVYAVALPPRGDKSKPQIQPVSWETVRGIRRLPPTPNCADEVGEQIVPSAANVALPEAATKGTAQ